MAVPTGTASLVLQIKLRDVDTATLAPLLASFLFPLPSWQSVLAPNSDDDEEEACLRHVKFLFDHPIPELGVEFGSKRSKSLRYTVMDEAAARGFLSVLQFLHQHGAIGCTTNAMWLHENRTFAHINKAVRYAARRGHLEVVRYLYEAAEAEWDLNAWHQAAGSGHLHVLQYLHVIYSNLPEEKREDLELEGDCEAVDTAVWNGDLEMVEWLYANRPERCGQYAFCDATKCDSLEMVAFLCENGHAFQWHEDAVNGAASAGRLDIVQYFFQNQSNHGFVTPKTIGEAAKGGNLELIQFLHETDFDGWTTSAMDNAAESGSLDIVQFLHTHRHEGCTTEAMDMAASNGHLHIVQFLHTHRHEGCTTRAMDLAASNGHLDIVHFFHTSRPEGFTPDALGRAAAHGHLDVVQFLYTNRPEGWWYNSKGVSREVVHKCITCGFLDVLQYLHDNALVELDPEDFKVVPHGRVALMAFLYENCVTHVDGVQRKTLFAAVLERAAYSGHLETIQYLDSVRRPGEVFESKALDIASAEGNLKMVVYLHHHGGHAGCTGAAMANAASGGHLDIVQFLHENRPEGCTSAAMDRAAINGHLDVAVFLHSHRTEGCSVETLLATVATMGFLDMAKFLCANRRRGGGGVCVQAAVDKVASRSGTAVQCHQYMRDYLETQLPCTCTKCVPTDQLRRE